ncbi:hypothetical protein OJF2_07200 [Aquisphaera giovannonii]|uniref:DUF302 domain-containing protein n=1 Tax=Aquisphaera giovannonii TaxID=406548 RepID=A0A5B9VWK7_9BACT|nr:DUF302 domain-containing protein [Aquisphaera giovannonii]QEH32251.1 hypothetical protein OJF2_07200 [Aquisphaera giovannonii]
MRLLCLSAAVLIIMPCLAAWPAVRPPAAAGGEGASTTVTRIGVDHVLVTAGRDYETVTARFREQLGAFDAAALKRSLEAGDDAATRAAVERMAGPSGFMLFNTQEHGALLGLVDIRAKAVQYVVGNPLFAVEMTRHAVGAGLYAPLRVLIREVKPGQTCIEYDRPSTLFGQFRDPEVDKVAAGLDRKLESLIESAVR